MPDGPPKPNGFLLIDKPIGPTSMQAVARIRHRAGKVRTGHGGTLDPRATGLLILALGPATRQLKHVVAAAKGYVTDIDLSIISPTDDLEGEIENVPVETPPSFEEVASSLHSFTGTIMQQPPVFSAIKLNGRRACDSARQGKIPELKPREVHVSSMHLLEYEWPIARIEIACGKGFYVRALARDLGFQLKTGGCCQHIRRTAIGPFTVEEAMPLDEAPDVIEQHHVIDPDAFLDRLQFSPEVESN